MSKLTQKDIILRFLRSMPESWFKSYDLRGKATPFGFTGHQADRRARELAEDKIIDVRHMVKYAEYKTKAPLKVEHFIVPVTGEKIVKTTWR